MLNMILDDLGFKERRSLKQTIQDAFAKLSGKSIDDKKLESLSSHDVDLLLSGVVPDDQMFDARALQNRDRSRQSYVVQMQKIAANPDYDRVSVSKTPDTGAPMVFSRGVSISSSQSGRQETVTMSDGKGGSLKVPTVYAVVEAKTLTASHDASGNKVSEYGGDNGIMALNNGRTAALKQSYKQNGAEDYRQALINDQSGHGIPSKVIEGMNEPVLVRVFSESAISHLDDPGAASNVSAGAQLSASEQAETDAKKLSDTELMQYQGGDINNNVNRDFVRSYISAMGGADAVGDMVTNEGFISAKGIKRIEGALVAKAYGDNAILNDLTENPDDDLKSLGKVLTDIAGRWAVMVSGSENGTIHPSMDITKNLTEAVTLIRKARQSGKSLNDLVTQADILSGSFTDPVTESLLRMMFRGENFNRVRSADKIKKAMHGFIDKAMATQSGADMFGHTPDPLEIMAQGKSELEAGENAGKAQVGLFDSVVDYFNDCGAIFDAESSLNIRERRAAKSDINVSFEALSSGDVGIMERRKLKFSIQRNFTRLSGEIEESKEPVKSTAEPTLDDKIQEAINSGVELSEKDISHIRMLHDGAVKLNDRADRLGGFDSHLDGVKRSFHLGMVGGSGPNNKSLNKRRARSLDKSIDNSKEAVELYNRAQSRITEIEKLLKGVGTEKDVAAKTDKREKSKTDIARMADNLKKGDTFGGKEVVRVTKDKQGYPAKVRYIDPESFDPVIEFWRIAFTSKDEFKSYVDKVRSESETTETAQSEELPKQADDSKLSRLTIPSVYTRDFHDSMMQQIIDMHGNVSVDDVKKAYKRVSENPDDTKELLRKIKNKDLEKIAGMAYRGLKKDRLVEGAYNTMITQFAYFNSDHVSYTYGEGSLQKTVKARVEALTQNELIEWAEDIHRKRAERKAQIEGIKKSIEDPQTLEDFNTLIRYKGKGAIQELSPDKLALYDELQTEAGILKKEEETEKKAQERGSLGGIEGGIAHEFAETTHAKKNIPLYVVKMTGDRMGKDQYREVLQKAKQLGGWYSKFRGQGAIPGFQFTSEEDRESFSKILKGETVDNSENIEARTEAREEAKKDNRIQKLTDIADRLEEQADAKLSQDRQTNTHRRANMAANAEADARQSKAYAQTMREIAEKMKTGDVKYLSNLSEKVQLKMLWDIAGSAASQYASKLTRTMGHNDYEQMKYALKQGQGTEEQVNGMLANVTLPEPSIHKSNILSLASKLEDIRGFKQIAGKVRYLSQLVEDGSIKFNAALSDEQIDKLMKLAKTNDDVSSSMGWYSLEQYANKKRMQRMGIETDTHARMALRELISLKRPEEKADPITALERDLIGKYRDLEWFNTPEPAAKEVVRLADIKPHHKMLEPSAGFGHLADAAVSRGIPIENIDVVEMGTKLVEALRMKGYNVVHEGNFLQYAKGKYDRIIMNPPFSKDKDIDHVLHAYSLLKPNGKLVAIVSGMTGDRQNSKNQTFREWLTENGADEMMLPEGSFKGSVNTTGVNSKIIVLEKGGDDGGDGEEYEADESEVFAYVY